MAHPREPVAWSCGAGLDDGMRPEKYADNPCVFVAFPNTDEGRAASRRAFELLQPLIFPPEKP